MRISLFSVKTLFITAAICGASPVVAAGAGGGGLAPVEAVDPDIEAAPEPAAEAIAGADDVVVLNLVPSNFNLTRSISFDEAGDPQHRNNQLSINFRCFYETPSTPLSYRDMEIISVITSAGEELEIDPNQQRRHQQNIQPNRQRNGKPYFDMYLNVPAPMRHAELIREVRGTLKMELSRGPERVLRFSPVSKYLGKRFRVTDMDDSPMSMKWIDAQDNQPAMIEWTFARSIEPLVQEVKFYRRNGAEFEANQRGGGGNNDTRSQRFAVGPADDVIMVVRLFRQTRTVEVPFVARDLPLPIAEPQGPRFDLAIATEPMGQPVGIKAGEIRGVEPADVARPGENDMPMIILD